LNIICNVFMVCIIARYYLCGHPGQQHGLRLPFTSNSHAIRIRRSLVSGFTAEVIQHIHSFFERGVSVFQILLRFWSPFKATFKSMGIRWGSVDIKYMILCITICQSFL
jgi:hypothetical protein